jgi:hypothetical protein
MRTKEQIKNLRMVMAYTIGLPSICLSDDQVNTWGDRIQTEADKMYYSNFAIKIKWNGEDKEWPEICTETKSVHCSMHTATEASKRILTGNPNIHSILIVDCKNKREFPRLVKRDEEEKTLSLEISSN